MTSAFAWHLHGAGVEYHQGAQDRSDMAAFIDLGHSTQVSNGYVGAM